MLCPICNGLEQLSVQCPSCAMQTDDLGRAVDFTAPYAPYQPDDDEATMTISGAELAAITCNHVVYCRLCQAVFEASVQKWP
ncbi:hypothetical protein [Paenibacillus rhizovicinus]|uniref:hypothetical protein n=1 Tax=Paenibacillus rhizovicinus TaxID=2704463 RepID=UPI001CDC7843|nr:hypothetical protein [Paenibacillus rhizovicinus]